MVKLCITSRCFVEISRWKLRQIEDTKSSYTKEQLEKRLAKLVGGVALIKVQLSVFFFPGWIFVLGSQGGVQLLFDLIGGIFLGH